MQGYGFFGSEAQQIQVGALYKDLTGNSLNIGGNPTVNYDGSFTFQFQAPTQNRKLGGSWLRCGATTRAHAETGGRLPMRTA